MKNYWKAGILGLMLAAAFGMAGCGKKESSTGAFEAALDTEKHVELNVVGFFGNFEALDQVTNDFNQYYPYVEFTYEQAGIETYDEYLESNPDVDILMTSENAFEQEGNLLTDLCADLSKEDLDLSAMDEKMLARGYHDGSLSCIPMGQNLYGLVVNVSLLEKEGLEIPKNYEEFLTVLTALKDKGYTPIQGPNSKVYAELTESMAYDLILNDESLCQDLMDGKESAAEALKPVYDRLDALLDGGFIDASVNESYPEDNYDQAIMNFFEGDVPFWVCNTEKVSGMKKRESKSEAFQANPFEYTYIFAPLGENGVYAYREPWYGFGVNKNSDAYDYAVEFLRFLATKDEINQIADIKGVPSVAAEPTDVSIYEHVLQPEQVELDGVNEGAITSAMTANWYTCVNRYMAGEYDSSIDALKNFVTMLTE